MPNHPQVQPNTNLASRLEAYAASVRANTHSDWSERLRGWTPYAAAIGSGLALSAAAEATPIYTSSNTTVSIVDSNNGVSTHKTIPVSIDGAVRFRAEVQFFGNAKATFSFGKVRLYGVHTTDQIEGSNSKVAKLASKMPVAANFATNHTVLFRRTHNTANNPANVTVGNWPSNSSGFAGIEFSTGTGKNATRFRGWIRLKWQDPANFPDDVTVVDFAFNNDKNKDTTLKTGDGIPSTGSGDPSAVPEPSSLALTLLATGSVGVLAWRKRRQAAAAASA